LNVRAERALGRAPVVTRTIADTRLELARARDDGRKIGLVPTMGSFHEGHLSLMRSARSECGMVAVSIFVNPAQFSAGEDLERYPRDLERDLELAEAEGVDLVFAPSEDEMYGRSRGACVIPGPAAEGLCGSARPGHFRGVATVVAKLFNIFQPDVAYFGQKDAQQAAVIREMAADLDFPVGIRVLPTVREADGLAMSSRNSYLSPEERRAAKAIYRALSLAREEAAAGEGDTARLTERIGAVIAEETLAELEYAEVVDPHTMAPLESVDGKAMAAVAVHIGGTRLIDNILLERCD